MKMSLFSHRAALYITRGKPIRSLLFLTSHDWVVCVVFKGVK